MESFTVTILNRSRGDIQKNHVRNIKASNHEHAARIFAEEDDLDGEYDIAHGEKITVEVISDSELRIIEVGGRIKLDYFTHVEKIELWVHYQTKQSLGFPVCGVEPPTTSGTITTDLSRVTCTGCKAIMPEASS